VSVKARAAVPHKVLHKVPQHLLAGRQAETVPRTPAVPQSPVCYGQCVLRPAC
jgi:hypothetical protein